MIKDGMWFDDEAHYRHYLRCMKKACAERFQPDMVLEPLVKRLGEILLRKAKEVKK